MNCSKNKCINRLSKIFITKVQIENQPFDFISQNQKYTILFILYSNIKTKPFSNWFGVSNVNQAITHIFNIRYNLDIFNNLSESLVIIYNDISYNIINFENKDELRNEIIISASRRGSVTIPDIQLNEN